MRRAPRGRTKARVCRCRRSTPPGCPHGGQELRSRRGPEASAGRRGCMEGALESSAPPPPCRPSDARPRPPLEPAQSVAALRPAPSDAPRPPTLPPQMPAPPTPWRGRLCFCRSREAGGGSTEHGCVPEPPGAGSCSATSPGDSSSLSHGTPKIKGGCPAQGTWSHSMVKGAVAPKGRGSQKELGTCSQLGHHPKPGPQPFERSLRFGASYRLDVTAAAGPPKTLGDTAPLSQPKCLFLW